jgi:hypothetical protein
MLVNPPLVWCVATRKSILVADCQWIRINHVSEPAPCMVRRYQKIDFSCRLSMDPHPTVSTAFLEWCKISVITKMKRYSNRHIG